MWIKSRIQKSWGQTNNNCRCIFQIQHIVTQTWQNLCIHKTPCYDFLKRITSVLREKLCLTIARDFTLPFEDVINCILWDIRVSAPGWASYDSIIKDSDTVFIFKPCVFLGHIICTIYTVSHFAQPKTFLHLHIAYV